MPIALVCALSLVLVGLAAAALALRSEFLVVLHLPRAALVFLERGEGGHYRIVPPLAVPLTVLRFAARATSLAPDTGRRALARAGIRAALPASGKA